MKLSIVVACYNLENYITRCINSILPQLGDECELVIINDGSTDCSKDIAEQLVNNTQNASVISYPNGGLATARNRGIDSTQGDYLWFIDGDDFIRPGAIDTILGVISKQKSHIVAFNHTIHQSVCDVPVIEFKHRSMSMAEFLSIGSRHYAWNKIYHRSLFTNTRFIDGLRNIEDFVFNLCVSNDVESVTTIQDNLYVYEGTNLSSISMNRSLRHLRQLSDETFKAHKVLLNRYPTVSNPKLKAVWDDLLATSYAGHIFSLVRFYNCRTVKDAIAIYKTWGIYPFAYHGNIKTRLFTFFVNNPITWPFAKVFIKYIIKS